MMISRAFLPVNYRYCSISFNMATTLFRRNQSSLVILPQHMTYKNCYSLLKSILKTIVHEHGLKLSYSVSANEVKKLSDLISKNLECDDSAASQELKQIVEYLMAKGYTSKKIREKFLEHLKSKDISCAKFKLLEDIDPDIELLLPFLSLPKSILNLIAKISRADKFECYNFSNRIYYLSHHLDIEPRELVPALVKHSTLLTMNFDRLNERMNILKNANINPKYIVKDLWIFNYKEDMITSRIQAAMKAGVDLKPWMLRCSENIFHSILIKNIESQRILGNETLKSYLAKRLDCSVEYIEYIMERNKLLKSINISKLDQILNFLYEKGYSPEEIRVFPRVFCSSVQSMEEKFENLKKIKTTLPTIPQLCMSKKKTDATLKEDS